MVITSIGLLIAVLSAIYIAWPLLSQAAPTGVMDALPEATALEKQKEAALEAIQELDFDLRVGKLSQEDHASLRADLEKRALDAMSALDDAQEGDSTIHAVDGGCFCPSCGNRFKRDARFCVSCGKKFPKAGSGRGRRRANS
ncbi:MAG: hypothetical protein P8R42_27480 [Candidatus Binatia bacterium]|nr:hypothetical protein [Candidatus Binatia bacterium]